MPFFCYWANQSTKLTSITLGVGEEAQPILVKADPPSEPIDRMLVWQEVGVMLAEESSFYSPGNSWRKFRITGRGPGLAFINVLERSPFKEIAGLEINVLPPQSSPDLIYKGKYLLWQGSLPRGISAPWLLFPATSGLDSPQAKQQTDKDQGPVPEGIYSLKARYNPNQDDYKKANDLYTKPDKGPSGTLAFDNTEQGIEFLPVEEESKKPRNDQWGTRRVRLEPIQGNMFKRDGFYLHNSQKGFSHGCIEVGKTSDGTDFFEALERYAADPATKPFLLIQVKYSYPDQVTVGPTKRQ